MKNYPNTIPASLTGIPKGTFEDGTVIFIVYEDYNKYSPYVYFSSSNAFCSLENSSYAFFNFVCCKAGFVKPEEEIIPLNTIKEILAKHKLKAWNSLDADYIYFLLEESKEEILSGPAYLLKSLNDKSLELVKDNYTGKALTPNNLAQLYNEVCEVKKDILKEAFKLHSLDGGKSMCIHTYTNPFASHYGYKNFYETFCRGDAGDLYLFIDTEKISGKELLKITVPKEDAPHIIGKGGKKIKEIASELGVKQIKVETI